MVELEKEHVLILLTTNHCFAFSKDLQLNGGDVLEEEELIQMKISVVSVIIMLKLSE